MYGLQLAVIAENRKPMTENCMEPENMGYLDLKYKPDKTDVIVEYLIEPDGVTLEKAAEDVASESSIGTWTDISTMKPEIAKRLMPHVFSADRHSGLVKIAYPVELFEKGNMPQIMSSIGGNIFGMKVVRSLRLEDIHFPKEIVKSFRGPKFGIDGIRKLMRVPKRPLVGTIIKPKVGLGVKDHARVAYESWVGGCDIVKDDENLSSMTFNPFNERITETLRMRDKAEKETGEKKIYMANVTAETGEMLKRANFVKDCGGEYAMVDIITCGWSGLQTLREADLGLVLHAHRAGHAMFTRGVHGMSMLVIAEIARMIGVDQLHIGALGKMTGTVDEVRHINEMIENKFVHPLENAHILEQDWHDVKPVFAVCSGGLYPQIVPRLVELLGNNIIVQAGGGVHGHPGGTIPGAKAMRQAIDAAMEGTGLEAYARKHIELAAALKKWPGK